MSTNRYRRILPHALIAALLTGAAVPVAWTVINRVEAKSHVRALAGNDQAKHAALAHLFAAAGDQPALVRALAREAKVLPPDTAAEALRVAAQSCANAGEMNPQVAQAAQHVLPRLEPKAQLLLVANLGAASLDAKKKFRQADTTAFDRALGSVVGARVKASLETDAPERALKFIGLFQSVAPIDIVAQAGRDAYLAHLETEDGAALLKYVAALNGAGLWGASVTRPALYNRWLEALAGAKGADTRDWAITLIRTRAGQHPELCDLLLRLTKDADPAVRLAALHAATEWAHAGASVKPAFAAALRDAASDTDPAVAREAWLTLGLLGGAPPAVPAHLGQLPSPVAEAAYATLAKARPHDAQLAEQLVSILKARDTQAVSAAHALTLLDVPAAKQALATLLEKPADDTLGQLCQWRALLCATPQAAGAWLRHPALPGTAPLSNAAAFAAQEIPANLTQALTDKPARLLRLAALEGLPPASATFATPQEDCGLAFYALARAEKDPAKVAAHLRPLFGAKESVWRDLACLLAARRLNKTQATELARDLLSTPADETMMSGALLTGLTKSFPKRVLGGSAAFRLQHPEWTEEKLYAASDTERAKLGLSTLDALTDNLNRFGDARSAQDKGVLLATQIGLALRGDSAANFDALVFDKRIPASTVLLAMLAQDAKTRADALDILLGDDVRPPFIPRQLLADWRFGEVLAECLPKEGPDAAPHISYWADIHLQNLQFEQLRAWWRLRKNAKK